MSNTIFERAGGFASVRRIVAAFYDRVLDSEMLQGYFVDTDFSRLVDHQTKFIAAMMGGPASFPDEVIRRAHMGLGITPREFLEMADILRDTLLDHGVMPSDAEQVHAEVLKREPLIVARAA